MSGKHESTVAMGGDERDPGDEAPAGAANAERVASSGVVSKYGADVARKRALEPGPGNVRMFVYRATDAELLERIRSRHPGAMSLLHARFGEEVNRLVWRILGADNEHDDLVQDIFIKLMAKVHRARDPEALTGWVRAVTVNAVRSELRKRRVRRLFLRAEGEKPDRFKDGIANAEGRDALRKIYAVLDQLPPDDRIAFVLRHVEGLAVPDVAAQCDCSVATIKRRVARAWQLLAPLRAEYSSVWSNTSDTGAEGTETADFIPTTERSHV